MKTEHKYFCSECNKLVTPELERPHSCGDPECWVCGRNSRKAPRLKDTCPECGVKLTKIVQSAWEAVSA